MTSVYRDADGLRRMMNACKSPLAAKVLANEYVRSCNAKTSRMDYPLWLQTVIGQRAKRRNLSTTGKNRKRVSAADSITDISK